MAKTLTTEDVERLVKTRSTEARADTSTKIAQAFKQEELSDHEREIAQDIFRVLVQDAQERVRSALAENLKDSPEVSPDIASALARDASDAVALPIIQFSEALDDAELIDIIRSQGAARQVAVASRAAVSEDVSDAIVDNAGEDAVVALVGNEGAEIRETALEKVTETYGDNERVQAPLVHRKSLPATVTEKLLARVSDHLKDHLVKNHAISRESADDLIQHSRERATVRMLADSSSNTDVMALAEQLKDNGRLTPSLLLRSLCLGDLSFFEAGLAVLSRIPVSNAHLLIHDPGGIGLRSLYDHARLPRQLFPAFESACKLALTSELERTDADPETRMRHMVERILTMNENIVDTLGVTNVDYLLQKFNQLAREEEAGA